MTTLEVIVAIVVLTFLGSCMYDLLEENWKEKTTKRKIATIVVIVAFAIIWGYVNFIWQMGSL